MAQYGLTDQQVAFVQWVVDTMANKVDLVSPAEPGVVNRGLVKSLGEAGLLRKLFGGADDEPPSDAAALQLCLLRESIAKISTEAETALALQGLGSYPILQSGSPETIDRWMPGVVSGDVVAAFALTEPDAGSDAAALALRAEPDGTGWRLSGTKKWISNAPGADVYTVFARTTEGARARGVTAFAVPGDAAGLSGQPLQMISPHPLGVLEFDGVRVDRDQVLGGVDAGFKVAMRTLDLFRPSVGAFALGMATAALDHAVGWAAERDIYGGKLKDQQSAAHTLAEMATRVEASRLLVRSAASLYDSGAQAEEISASAAMAKLFATESAQWVVDQAVQLNGARALEHGHLLEHLYRDVRAPRIYEGASEVQRTIIGRHLLRGL